MSEVIIRTLWIYGLTIVVSLAVAVVIKVIVVALNRLERKPLVPAQPLAVPPAPLSVEADHIAVIAAAVFVIIETAAASGCASRSRARARPVRSDANRIPFEPTNLAAIKDEL